MVPGMVTELTFKLNLTLKIIGMFLSVFAYHKEGSPCVILFKHIKYFIRSLIVSRAVIEGKGNHRLSLINIRRTGNLFSYFNLFNVAPFAVKRGVVIMDIRAYSRGVNLIGSKLFKGIIGNSLIADGSTLGLGKILTVTLDILDFIALSLRVNLPANNHYALFVRNEVADGLFFR